jgi:HlyD family secretion protein
LRKSPHSGVPDAVPAKVSLISPALDPGSTTVEVWLRINNAHGTLKAGTPVRVSIAGKTIQHALKVPVSAVLTAQDGSKSVMVAGADGVAHRKAIETGIQDGSEVQVSSGLSSNDMVITTGAYAMDDGTKVKIGADGGDDKPAAGKSGDDK